MSGNLALETFVKQMKSIVYKSFNNKDLFKNQLKYMMNFPEEHWYNIMSIFSYREDAIKAQSLEAWALEFDVKNVYATKETGIPYIDTYQIISEETLDFEDKEKIIKVFDYKQLDFSYSQFNYLKGTPYIVRSPLCKFINDKAIRYDFKNNWQQFVVETCYENKFYKSCTIEQKSFIEIACMIASSEVNKYEDDIDLDIIKSLTEKEKFSLFINVQAIIKNLTERFIQQYLLSVEAEKKEEYTTMIRQRLERNLDIRIMDAKQVLIK